jgi:hypothetical protein
MNKDQRLKKFRAQISFKNKPIHIGLFATKQEAEKAKQVARKWLERKYGNPNHYSTQK